MFEAPPSDLLVPYDGSFSIADAPTEPRRRSTSAKDDLEDAVSVLYDLQRRLYADNRWSVLLMFQAMDAAGKDSTIRNVLTGVNPAGCQVHSFGKPSAEELDHDFLWRCASRLPERGRIGVFNRSWYEEVLIVRVHPQILDGQRLPPGMVGPDVWNHRLESIADFERHLARNGTVILKFFLNLSFDEQRKRFLRRIDREDKNWKFNEADVEERAHWNDYMQAYEAALQASSRPWAPWYAIPADDKPSMRVMVAQTITDALGGLGLEYPTLAPEAQERLAVLREGLTES